MNKVTEVLELAKEILESEVEWCQGSLYKYNDNDYRPNVPLDSIIGACALGAVDLAAERLGQGWYEDTLGLTSQARRRLSYNVPGPANVAEFNDDPGTTKEDVLMAFKRAIVDEGELEWGKP